MPWAPAKTLHHSCYSSLTKPLAYRILSHSVQLISGEVRPEIYGSARPILPFSSVFRPFTNLRQGRWNPRAVVPLFLFSTHWHAGGAVFFCSCSDVARLSQCWQAFVGIMRIFQNDTDKTLRPAQSFFKFCFYRLHSDPFSFLSLPPPLMISC